MIAAAYRIPMLEVGTLITETTAQADVRLFIPGSGCYGCAEKGFAPARETLLQDSNTRRGSLLWLNMLAVSAAMELLERFYSGSFQQSQWRQFLMDRKGTGVFGERRREIGLNSQCTFCRQGAGDRAFEGITKQVLSA